MWWILFTAVDLYIGLVVLDALAPSLPPEEQRRLAVAKKVIIASIGLLAIALLASGCERNSLRRVEAWFLAIFLVPVTLTMHNFWAMKDPMMAQIQMAMFTKNLSMLGGALLISQFGAGPLSLDAKKDSGRE